MPHCDAAAGHSVDIMHSGVLPVYIYGNDARRLAATGAVNTGASGRRQTARPGRWLERGTASIQHTFSV